MIYSSSLTAKETICSSAARSELPSPSSFTAGWSTKQIASRTSPRSGSMPDPVPSSRGFVHRIAEVTSEHGARLLVVLVYNPEQAAGGLSARDEKLRLFFSRSRKRSTTLTTALTSCFIIRGGDVPPGTRGYELVAQRSRAGCTDAVHASARTQPTADREIGGSWGKKDGSTSVATSSNQSALSSLIRRSAKTTPNIEQSQTRSALRMEGACSREAFTETKPPGRLSLHVPSR